MLIYHLPFQSRQNQLDAGKDWISQSVTGDFDDREHLLIYFCPEYDFMCILTLQYELALLCVYNPRWDDDTHGDGDDLKQ